ncbi:MAG: amidophosphoribosyltransferase, partial [Candidatus Omnitrophota bacterium]
QESSSENRGSSLEQDPEKHKMKLTIKYVFDVWRSKEKILLVEDSIVRGTTSKIRVKTVRDAGAKSVHMRVSCPPLKFPCFYGIDFPTQKELIAAKQTIQSIEKYLGLDSLKYLSIEGMLKSMRLPKEEFCTACFNGKYPGKIPERFSKKMLEKNR